MKEYINDALKLYRENGRYPWHMPGHKRQTEMAYIGNNNSNDVWSELFAMDYTEAKDLDDMHNPKLFIKDSLDAIRHIYGTHKTYMLVNGSTVGILTAIFACTKPGDNILVARNCHKSVYNAIELRGLTPFYIMPECEGFSNIAGPVIADRIKDMLHKMKEIRKLPAAVVITSPTYEGVISDVKKIAEEVHAYNIPLIVDEAQGAHFEYIDRADYKTAMKAGADIVIESLHKTMPALTQTSLLHITESGYEDNIEKYLNMFQTSSPSYVFMQSMEKAIRYGDSQRRKFASYIDFLKCYRKKYDALKHIRLFQPDCMYDVGKLVFLIKAGTFIKYEGTEVPFTGKLFGDILADKYGQVVELTYTNYIISMTSVFDRHDAYDKLFSAIEQIDRDLCIDAFTHDKSSSEKYMHHIPNRVYISSDVHQMDKKHIDVNISDGMVAAEYVYAYPPGIPVLVPGERIDNETISGIQNMIEAGLNVEGIENMKICVIK